MSNHAHPRRRPQPNSRPQTPQTPAEQPGLIVKNTTPEPRHHPSTAHPRLDQLAEHFTQARNAGGPTVTILAKPQSVLLRELVNRLENVDPDTIGAVLLTTNDLLTEYLGTFDDTLNKASAVILLNLMGLTGTDLYTARARTPVVCPFPRWNGAGCTFSPDGGYSDEQLDAVMRGHVSLHHPDHTWPGVSADADPAETVVDKDQAPVDGEAGA